MRVNSNKLQFYKSFKEEYTPTTYLDLSRKANERKPLVKLRLRNHELMIELGR